MPVKPPVKKGRGSHLNPINRFESVELVMEDQENSSQPGKTEFLKDFSKSIISYNNSPDIPFEASLNPYRGCEHGCSYCYARPTHEYLGFSLGLDFEKKIVVKEDAADLLKKSLMSKSWNPQTLAMSGVTDPYQPVEKNLRITEKCLTVLNHFKNPVIIITKNNLVTRDIEILKELAEKKCIAVLISITTLKESLRRVMEPRTSSIELRFNAVKALSQANIPVGILMGPVIPGLNDSEAPEILKHAAQNGAQRAGFIMLRLPYGVAPLFSQWLEDHFPEHKKKVLNQIKSMRQGKLYHSDFNSRMKGKGIFAEQFQKLFDINLKKYGLNKSNFKLSTSSFIRPNHQMNLFN